MEETALGPMRRTHHSAELGPDTGKVTIMGWVEAVRAHKSIAFLTVRDRTGSIHVVAKEGACPDALREDIAQLKPHSTIGITGNTVSSPKSPTGVELIPSSMSIFSAASKIAPFEPQAKTVKNIETRLDLRPIDLRRQTLRDIFRIRDAVLSAVRAYLRESEFLEVHTPKMIASATEGGAALFSIFYYAKQAFLAQSPQLYKEQLTMPFERVYEIGPIFRAESSRTNRHLSEAISIDIEEAFADYTDVMDRTEEIVRRAAAAASECTTDMDVPKVEKVPRYKYADLLARMQKAGLRTQWGDDLYPSALKKLEMSGFYFITDWPLGPKPFYVQPSPDDPRVSESFDLMFGDLEISSGSTRVARRSVLEERLKSKGMNPESFESHLGAFEYGMPPHAGCGIGLERLMMALTGTQNIRDTTLYPRDVDRLVP